MRRSSLIVIVAAILIGGIGIVSYAHPFDVAAGPMSATAFGRILDNARAAFEYRSVDGIMSWVADDADMFGMNRGRFRSALRVGFSELGRTDLRVRWSNLAVEQHGSEAVCSCDLTIGETTERMVAMYAKTRVTLRLRRQTMKTWFGLRNQEAWLITQAVSSDALPLPDASP